jgi:hypothetical protein
MKTNYIIQAFLGSFLLFGYSLSAQSLSRQTIFSTGGSNLVDGVWISQTIGQSYNTTANYSNGISYRPGFQQPACKSGDKAAVYQLSLTLFPNPVVTSLTIRSTEAIPNAIIQVIDIKGALIYTNSVKNLTTYTIDCQHWTPGTYTLNVSNGKSGFYSSKVIINN